MKWYDTIMTASDPRPKPHHRHVYWHAKSQCWQVRVQRGPHAGNYGYFYDLDDAKQTADAADRGELTPGTKSAPKRIQERRPLAGPRKPPDRSTPSSRSSTGVRGVSWNSQHGKYHVRILFEGSYRSFGLYDDLEDAAEVARQVFAGERRPRPRLTPEQKAELAYIREAERLERIETARKDRDRERQLIREAKEKARADHVKRHPQKKSTSQTIPRGFAPTDPHRARRSRPLNSEALERAQRAARGGVTNTASDRRQTHEGSKG